MARFTGATLSVVGGLVGALVVAGTVATGCGGDDNGGNNNPSNTTTSSKTTSSSTSTTSGTATTSATSATTGDSGVKDAGPDGDATVPPAACNTAALLGIDAGQLLFSFDDGGISVPVGSTTASWTVVGDQNPLDASFQVTGSGNSGVGASCPGSFEMTIPLSTTGQGAVGHVLYPGVGTPYTAKVIHLSIGYTIANDTDASAFFHELLEGPDGGGFSYITPYAQWSPPEVDGGAPDAGYKAQNFGASVANGFSALPNDGGFLAVNVPITDQGDGGALTTPTTIYLNQIGVQVRGPQANADSGPVPLDFPVGLQFFIDDVWLE